MYIFKKKIKYYNKLYKKIYLQISKIEKNLKKIKPRNPPPPQKNKQI